MARFLPNRHWTGQLGAQDWPAERDVRAFHRAIPGYAPTPLVELPELAAELGLAQLWVKDESRRLGLAAFKVLGASYGLYRCLRVRHPTLTPELLWSSRGVPGPPSTFCTATDGNHGRAVAWAAGQWGQRAVVYVPGNTVPARVEAIRAQGAQVVVVDGTYDEAVERCAREAAQQGWQVVSDTTWPGYQEIPRWIVEGYSTLFHEVDEALAERGEASPTLVLLQGGVGAMPCAGVLHAHRHHATALPTLVSVEPTDADCLFESAASADGGLRRASGRLHSMMAGLNCGQPSEQAWPVLRAGMNAFLAIEDSWAEQAMRTLASASTPVVSGESGAAGLAGLLCLAAHRYLPLAGHRALVLSTEGATDPESYRRVLEASR